MQIGSVLAVTMTTEVQYVDVYQVVLTVIAPT